MDFFFQLIEKVLEAVKFVFKVFPQFAMIFFQIMEPICSLFQLLDPLFRLSSFRVFPERIKSTVIVVSTHPASSLIFACFVSKLSDKIISGVETFDGFAFFVRESGHIYSIVSAFLEVVLAK